MNNQERVCRKDKVYQCGKCGTDYKKIQLLLKRSLEVEEENL